MPSRVLVVDDEPLVADSLVLILGARGFDTRAVYSGEDAAELAVSWKPDAVISDVVMGTMNGIDLAIYVGQVLPSCKVILMSGNLITGDLMTASEKLGHHFTILAKPFMPETLLEFLEVTH